MSAIAKGANRLFVSCKNYLSEKLFTKKDDSTVLKLYIQDQPDKKFNCTSSGPAKKQKVCYYNDYCGVDSTKYTDIGHVPHRKSIVNLVKINKLVLDNQLISTLASKSTKLFS